MPRKRTQPTQAAPTGTYGQAAELERSQNVVPLPNTQIQPRPVAGAAGQFARPSEAPDEPITAGAPFGPGPLAAPSVGDDDTGAILRSLYARFPNKDLARLLEVLG